MTLRLKLQSLALLLACLSPLNAQAVLLPVIADTYLAATAVGTSETINVNSTNTALLNFDLSTLPVGINSADISKASLVVFVKTVPTSGKLQVSPVTSTWTESTVKTTTAPSVGLALATSAPFVYTNRYYAVDVTQLVKNWLDAPSSNKGLALDPVGQTSLTLDSKEATKTSHSAYIDVVLQGAVGAKGDKGPTGILGVAGAQGLKGDAGPKGDRGVTGAQGVQGIQGAQGSAGALPVGQAVGDMPYWNGSAWITITAGLPNATLTFCNNKPTWTTSGCPSPAKVYKIGDTGPAGGKVFYLSDAAGLHGLEAAPVDQSNAKWGCNGTLVGGTGRAVGTGKANTAAIKAKCGTGTGAQIAASYSLNGFTDWYLPSLDELILLYAQKARVGGFANKLYLSSWELDGFNSWGLDFSDGSETGYGKGYAFLVRAVRTF